MKHLSIHTMHTNNPHTIPVSCNACLSFRDDLNSLHGTCSPAELIFTGRNEVVAKVMFLLVSVILLTGGVSPSVHAEIPPPPRADTPRHPLGADTPLVADTTKSRHPPRADTPPGSRLRHTVNERPVRILLECILVKR